MTSWIAQNDWSEVHVNDEVRVTRDGGMLTGKIGDLHKFSNGEIHALALLVHGLVGSIHITHLVWSLFVPAKPAVVLPTEPGHYVDRTGNGWNIREGATSSLPEENAPYTRLEPVVVTAKKVLDAIDDLWTPGNIRDFTPHHSRRIAEQFGITE
jgi:hypothetical protein